MVRIVPIGEKLLIKPEVNETKKTEAGIIIAETLTEKPQIGEVVATGEGRILESGKMMPLTVKVGDRVIFRKFAGTEVKIDKKDEPLLLITERDILGIIKK